MYYVNTLKIWTQVVELHILKFIDLYLNKIYWPFKNIFKNK